MVVTNIITKAKKLIPAEYLIAHAWLDGAYTQLD